MDRSKNSRGGRYMPGFSLKTDGSMISDDQIKEWIREMIAGGGFAYDYLKLAWCLRRESYLSGCSCPKTGGQSVLVFLVFICDFMR